LPVKLFSCRTKRGAGSPLTSPQVSRPVGVPTKEIKGEIEPGVKFGFGLLTS